MTQPKNQVPPRTFKDPAIAARVRDAMHKQVVKTLRKIAPPPKKGRVIDVDFLNNTAMVWFAGDTAPVKCNIIPNIQPGQWSEKDNPGDGSDETSVVGAGSMVIVETRFNKLYITQVLSGGQFASDLRVAGMTTMSYGEDTVPRYNDGGDYTYKVNWSPPDGTPIPGGPYAINIGPFMVNKDRFAVDGTFDVDILCNGMSAKRYSWTMYPYFLYRNASGLTSPWWRVLPSQVHEDALQFKTGAGFQLNNQSAFATDLGDWSNFADTQLNVTWSGADNHSGTGGCMVIQPNVQHTTMKVKECPTPSVAVPVVEGGSYQWSYWCKPSVTTIMRADIDWLNILGNISSTQTGSTVSCPAGAWTKVTISASVPTGVAVIAANPVITPTGTVLTSTTLKIDDSVYTALDNTNKTDYDLDWSLRQTIHGSPDTDPANSPSELWLRIVINHIGPTVDTFDDNNGVLGFIIRHRNTHSWTVAKSTKTGLPVYEMVTTPEDFAGYYGFHDSNTPYTADTTQHSFIPYGSWSTGPWRNPELDFARRAQLVLAGGGTKTYDGTSFKWTSNFEICGIGRLQNMMPNGNATLPMPGVGEVLPVLPSGNTVTVTSSGIPLAPGQSLWYAVSPGYNQLVLPTSQFRSPVEGVLVVGDPRLAGGFFIVDNIASAAKWAPPEYAIMIAYRQNATSTLKLGTGAYVGLGHEYDFSSTKSLFIRGIEAGRVCVYRERIDSAASSGSVAGTETACFTTASSITFHGGYAYEIIVASQIKVALGVAVPTSPIVDIRETNASGLKIIQAPRVPIVAANTDTPVFRREVVKNATGSDVTVRLCVSVAPQSANAVTLDGAPAPITSYIEVWEIGDAADWPNNMQV
jgi:hypothetical protein